MIQSASATASATANANAVDVSNCRLDGSANGIQHKFDAAKYLACGLFADGQKATPMASLWDVLKLVTRN